MNRLSAAPGDRATPDPALSNAELVQLRMRVIALENLLITLLAQHSEPQLSRSREMAAYISPRPGYTNHPLTIRAAAQMVHLTQRAARIAPRPADKFVPNRTPAHRTNSDPRQ